MIYESRGQCYLSFFNLGWSQLVFTDTVAKNQIPNAGKNEGIYKYKKLKIKNFTSTKA